MTLDRFERKKEVQSKDWFYEAITDGYTSNPNSAMPNSPVHVSNPNCCETPTYKMDGYRGAGLGKEEMRWGVEQLKTG